MGTGTREIMTGQNHCEARGAKERKEGDWTKQGTTLRGSENGK